MISIGNWARFPLHFPLVFGILCCSVSGSPNGPLPDLTVAVSTVPASPVYLADTWTVTVNVTNGGASAAPASVLRYRFTNAVTNQATNVDVPVPALSPGASFTDSYSGTYGGRVGSNAGTNSFLVIADAGGTVSESDETNNTASFSLPVMYPELVIDTYYPLSSGGPLGINALYLFDAAGTSITSETSGASLAPDTQPNFSGIDYTVGLSPGVYYVRIQALNLTSGGDYAIRVLQELPSFPIDMPDRDPSWFYAGLSSDSSYESLDGVSFTIPPNEAGMTFTAGDVATDTVNKLNRHLTSGASPADYDWVKVTLP